MRSPNDRLQTISCFTGANSSSSRHGSPRSSRTVLSSTTLKCLRIKRISVSASCRTVLSPWPQAFADTAEHPTPHPPEVKPSVCAAFPHSTGQLLRQWLSMSSPHDWRVLPASLFVLYPPRPEAGYCGRPYLSAHARTLPAHGNYAHQ